MPRTLLNSQQQSRRPPSQPTHQPTHPTNKQTALFASTAAAKECHLYSTTIESPCFTLQSNTSK